MPTAHFYLRAPTRGGLREQRQSVQAYYERVLARKGYLRGREFIDGDGSGKRVFSDRRGGFDCGVALHCGDALVISRLAVAFTSLRNFCREWGTCQRRDISLHVANLPADSSTPRGFAWIKAAEKPPSERR